MPRLTNRQYLDRRAFLQMLWDKRRQLFSYLSHRDQIYLHRYYSFLISDSDADHLAHRKWISRKDPSLPQTSGRAYRKLQILVREGKIPEEMRSVPDYEGTSRRHITIRSVLRPEPDYERIARSVLDLAVRLASEEEAREKAKD